MKICHQVFSNSGNIDITAQQIAQVFLTAAKQTPGNISKHDLQNTIFRIKKNIGLVIIVI